MKVEDRAIGQDIHLQIAVEDLNPLQPLAQIDV